MNLDGLKPSRSEARAGFEFDWAFRNRDGTAVPLDITRCRLQLDGFKPSSLCPEWTGNILGFRLTYRKPLTMNT
jgi:hypothetical protein